jgi:hypothetical protein
VKSYQEWRCDYWAAVKRERRRASVRVRAKPPPPGRVVEVALVALLVAALVALLSLAGALPP